MQMETHFSYVNAFPLSLKGQKDPKAYVLKKPWHYIAPLRLCAFAPLRLIVFSADAPRHETQLNAKEQRRKDAKEQYNAMTF